MVLIWNSIHACRALRRSIFALEADLENFDEVLKPLLDADSNKTILRHVFNLDDNPPIKKRSRINLNCE
jgi:hypothetical protein